MRCRSPLSVLPVVLGLTAVVGCTTPMDRWDDDPFAIHEPGTHFGGLVGIRTFDDPDWGTFDDQISLGVTYDMDVLGGWANLDAGFYVTGDDATVLPGPINLSTRTVEGTVGVVRWIRLGDSNFEGYVGAGTALQWTEAELPGLGGLRDSDGTFTGYVRAGLVLRLNTGGEYVGIDYRMVRGPELTLGGIPVDTDSHAVHVVFGVAF